MLRRDFLTGTGAALLCATQAHGETVIQVGATPSGVPFTFVDPKDGTMKGALVDITGELAGKLGMTAKIQPMVFGSLIPALTSKRIDLIAAAMTVTAAREKVVSFTDPLYSYGEGVFVPASDKKRYETIADMKGYRVGAQIGSRYIDDLNASGVFSEVKSYEGFPDLVSDLLQGRIKAAFFDAPIIEYNLRNNPKVRIVDEYKPRNFGQVAFAVRKDQEALLGKLNAALRDLTSEGKLKQSFSKWHL